MNKYRPLFDMPLAQYDKLNKYPPAEDIKRALEAHLVKYPDVPKKPTASVNNTTAGDNTNGSKRDKNGKKSNYKSTGQSSNQSTGQSANNQSASQSSTYPIYSTCGRLHRNRCWVTYPE